MKAMNNQAVKTKKPVFFWHWARRFLLFSLALTVSLAILLVLPLHQYFSKRALAGSDNAAKMETTAVSVNLEPPPKKKKKLDIDLQKPELSRISAQNNRFDLDLSASGGSGVAVAGTDVAELTYDSTSVDELPVRLRGRDPQAPDAFYGLGVSGRVQLELTIDANGDVGSVRVIQETPAGYGLGEACADAARSWKFRPAKVKGIDVKIRVVQPFAF